jgi:AraC-like DNA-binding protein
MDYIPTMGNPAPPFQVRTAGFVDRQPYHTTPGTRQGDVMLTVFLDGNGVYRNSAGAVYVHGGMAGLVPPEDAGVLMADARSPYVHYYCRFNGEYALAMAAAIREQRQARFFAVSNAEEIADAVRQMGRLSSRGLPSVMGKREALLVQALVALADPAHAEGTPPLVAGTIEEYLREHIAAATNLSRMADHFAVSRSTLCRVAKQACGDSIQRMHERMKVEWARTLLGLGRFNVAEVALRVGYRDPLYFSRVFRRQTGESPKRWARRELRRTGLAWGPD